MRDSAGLLLSSQTRCELGNVPTSQKRSQRTVPAPVLAGPRKVANPVVSFEPSPIAKAIAGAMRVSAHGRCATLATEVRVVT